MHEMACSDEPLLAKSAAGAAKSPDEAIAGKGFTLLEAGLLGPCVPPIQRRAAPEPAAAPRSPCSCTEEEPVPLTQGDFLLRRYLCGQARQKTQKHDGGMISIGGGSAAAHGDVVWTEAGNISPKLNLQLANFQPKRAIWLNRFDVLLKEAPSGSSAVFTFKKDGQTIGTVTVADGALSGTATPQGGSVEVTASNTITVEVTSIGRTKPGTTATMIARVAA